MKVGISLIHRHLFLLPSRPLHAACSDRKLSRNHFSVYGLHASWITNNRSHSLKYIRAWLTVNSSSITHPFWSRWADIAARQMLLRDRPIQQDKAIGEWIPVGIELRGRFSDVESRNISSESNFTTDRLFKNYL